MADDPESEAILTEIPASEILDKIQKGEPVVYDHVIKKGDLDLSKLNLTTKHIARTEIQVKTLKLCEELRVITSSMTFTNSKFDANINFSNYLLQDQIKIEDTIFSGNADFDGAKFIERASFFGVIFSGHANFSGTTFNGEANFLVTKFNKNADFGDAIFNGKADFTGTKFNEDTYFSNVTFGYDASFFGAEFNGTSPFLGLFFGATFSGDADFDGARFIESASFTKATFSGRADFRRTTFIGNAEFYGAKFSGDAYFHAAKFGGDVLTFRNATFTIPKSQEEACRRAKNVLAKAGNREEEEYHFYREMEARRIQKGIRGNSELGFWYLLLKTETWSARRLFGYDIIEYVFVQKIFRYGTDPYWLFGCWLTFVAAFTVIYWMGGAVGVPEINGEIDQSSNFIDYMWFSIATAATPGYALYKPLGDFKLVAGIQAILGTFMWAAFITTFARKFSR